MWVVAACGSSAPAPADAGPADGGAADAGGSDAGDAGATDAGFDPSSLAPCEIDPAGTFDATAYAAFVAPAAEPMDARLFLPFVLLAGRGGDLPSITDARRAGIRTAASCAGEAACVRAAIAWTAPDARAAGEALSAALGAELSDYASALRASGVCVLFDVPDDGELVASCVDDALIQATAAVDAHVLGELDASTLDAVIADVASGADGLAFWEPAVHVATRGLLVAERDEAVRYEPLADGENAATIARLRGVDFDAYPFAAILVLGQGPIDAETALNPAGRDRADMGYQRWLAGLAPVILLSGGHVHPDRTAFSEAVEMRRHLVENRGLPADAALIDPYARHTTTNLRNASRILIRAGVPADRPILVTSDLFQSFYVASDTFATRCDDELHYRPFAERQVLSDYDSCFVPVAASLEVDARDPLDP